MKQRGASVVHSQKHTPKARPQSHNLWRHIRTTTFGCAPKMGYEETITGFTALWISVYLIILPILNFISVPNEIFVGICNLNLLISLIFIFILFRNILDFSNLKSSHFSDPYFIIYYDENVIIRITSGTLGMYKDLFEKIEEKLKYQKQGV